MRSLRSCSPPSCSGGRAGRGRRLARCLPSPVLRLFAHRVGDAAEGTVALILCGLACSVATASSAEARSRLRTLRWAAGLGITGAVAAPWFVYMGVRFGRAFIHGYVLDE